MSQNSNDDDFPGFEDFGAPSGAPPADLPPGGPDDDDQFGLDEMPAPPGAATKTAASDVDEFGNIGNDDGSGFGGADQDFAADPDAEDPAAYHDDGGDPAELGGDDDAQYAEPEFPDTGVAEPPSAEDKKRQLISKLIYPAGGLFILVLVGYFFWPIISNVIGLNNSSRPAPTMQAAPAPRPQPQAAGPQLPPASRPQLPAAGPQLPSAQGAQPSLPQPALPQPALPQAQAPQLPAPVSAPQMGSVQMPGDPVAMQPSLNGTPSPAMPSAGNEPLPPSSMNRPGQIGAPPGQTAETMPSGIESALNSLVAEMRSIGRKVDGFEANLTATRSELIARADRTDDKLYGVQRQVEDVDGRISGLEERLSALEAARKRPTASAAPVSAPKPKAKPASRPAKADDDEVKPAKSHGKVVTEEPQSQNVIAGYKLRGVSRGAAIVEGPGGLIRIEMGQTIPGVGIVKEARRQDDVWVLLTSNGIIRP